MDYRRFGNRIIVRLDKDEEIVEQLRILARKEHIRLASVQGLGAVKDFETGVFDVGTKQFRGNRFQGLYEITSLVGTIDTMNGETYIHLHMSAGDQDGVVRGGHLSRAVISATGELVVTVIDGEIDRKFDPEIGLNLFCF